MARKRGTHVKTVTDHGQTGKKKINVLAETAGEMVEIRYTILVEPIALQSDQKLIIRFL